MDTSKMDIVYFVKDGFGNEEFRFSLRSVCENLQFNRIWVFGGCPKDIIPDFRVRAEQVGKTKWDRVRNMFLMACENKEITDDFILFNDDFFVMQPTDKIEPLYRDTLENHINILPKGPYANLLKTVKGDLENNGESTYSYELHTPFVFNKKKLHDLIMNTPELHCTRTLYGNIYKIGGRKHHDVKAFNSSPSFDYKNSTLLSTDDAIITSINPVWNHIRKSFPNKCKYEQR